MAGCPEAIYTGLDTTSYGNVVISSDADSSGYVNVNPIRFSTKWFDTELSGATVDGAVGQAGLGYWGYRYHSPRLGRWLSRDPVLDEEISRSWTVLPDRLSLLAEMHKLSSLYSYAGNGPTIYNDPDGRIAPVVVAAIIAGGCAVVVAIIQMDDGCTEGDVKTIQNEVLCPTGRMCTTCEEPGTPQVKGIPCLDIYECIGRWIRSNYWKKVASSCTQDKCS